MDAVSLRITMSSFGAQTLTRGARGGPNFYDVNRLWSRAPALMSAKPRERGLAFLSLPKEGSWDSHLKHVARSIVSCEEESCCRLMRAGGTCVQRPLTRTRKLRPPSEESLGGYPFRVRPTCDACGFCPRN